MIVDRIRPILVDLVEHNQCSFIPGRQVGDNIVIAQEILHKMANTKGKKGAMAVKIDLKKAYDRISWSFLKETLEMAGLPGNLAELIMNCVQASMLQVL